METDYSSADLSVRERAMLDYSHKLAVSPQTIEKADVGVLRGAGFVDSEIHDICHTVSYYCYVNRMADGLGVELENYWAGGPPPTSD